MKRALFIWIPRTSGTSLWLNIEHCSKTSQRIIQNEHFDPNVEITTFQHWNLGQATWFFNIPDNWIESCWVFSIVRNSWDRLVSLYHILEQGQPKQQELIRYLGGTFESFAEFLLSGRAPPVGPDGYAGGAFYGRPQFDWYRYRKPDYIGKFEELEVTWKEIEKHLGVPLSLVKANASIRKPYQEYYSPALRDAIGEYYQEEISQFNYTFD